MKNTAIGGLVRRSATAGSGRSQSRRCQVRPVIVDYNDRAVRPYNLIQLGVPRVIAKATSREQGLVLKHSERRWYFPSMTWHCVPLFKRKLHSPFFPQSVHQLHHPDGF